MSLSGAAYMIESVSVSSTRSYYFFTFFQIHEITQKCMKNWTRKRAWLKSDIIIEHSFLWLMREGLVNLI